MADMTTPEKVDVDDILHLVGGFDRFQWICNAAFCIMVIPPSFQVLIMYFVGLKPLWKCMDNSNVCTLNGTHDSTNTFRCTISRNEWEFTEPKGFSIATQFDIYCSEEWLLDLTTGMFFLGAGTGGLFLGKLADSIGRKNVLFTSLAILILVGGVSALVPNIYLFIACRFLVGVCYAATLGQMIVMVVELVKPSRRSFAANSVWLFYSLALCVIALKAYIIKEWKILIAVCTAPYLLVLLLYKQVPESVRWLLVKGRQNEAEEIFNKMAKRNQRSFQPGVLTVDSHEIELISSSFKDLFRPLTIAVKTGIQCYAWFVTNMVYYGLSLAAHDLGGSIYRNFALVSLMECPGHIAGAFLSNRYGRKKTTALPMLLASIICIIIPFIPVTRSINISRVILAMLGKFFITTCYSCLYLWSAEMFPTPIRAKGIGLMQVFEMLGGACAPFIINALQSVTVVAPFIVLGSFAIISSGLMSFLPEPNRRRIDTQRVP